MDASKLPQYIPNPINVIFDGSNYDLWAEEMCSFLKGRLLWRIVTGEIPKPTKKADEEEEKFTERLVSWDGMNHQILTWFRNTCAKVIKIDFRRFDTAQEVWNFLKNRYSVSDDVNQFQLYRRLHRMQQ